MTSSPLNRTSPSVFSIRRKIVRPVVDLPQPDSPTSPIVVPRLKLKDTSSTAFALPVRTAENPPLIGKYFFRWDTSRMLPLPELVYLCSVIVNSTPEISHISPVSPAYMTFAFPAGSCHAVSDRNTFFTVRSALLSEMFSHQPSCLRTVCVAVAATSCVGD